MKNKKIKSVTHAAVIAATYVVLTYLTNLLGLANGAVQCRLSEAMCVLPAFTPSAVPGLFIGCMLSNILTGCSIPDIVFGSIATLIGAYGALVISRKKCSRYFLCIPTIVSNAVIVPFVLKYSYGISGGLWYFFVTVALGEIISCGILGNLLYKSLYKKSDLLFK
jgi:uncharacterized membrane protein